VFRILILTLLPLWAHAQVTGNVRTIGMAGAVRGDPVGNSAVVSNPAGMSRSYAYSAEAFYERSAPGYNAAGLNVVDSKTQPAMAVGVAYAYQFTDADQPVDDGHDARLALAHAFVQQVFSVGLGLHYVHIDREVPGEDGKLAEQKVRTFTLDAGMLISPVPSLHLGVVGNNLIASEDERLPRRAGGGIAFTGELLTLDVDVLADFDTAPDPVAVVQTGAEAVLGGAVPVRAGFEYNGATDQKWVAGGIGFIDTRTRKEANQLNIAFKQNIDDTHQWIFAADMVIYL